MIDKLLLKALPKQPEDRYPDMEALAAAMRALLNTQPTPRPWWQNRWLWVGAGMLMLIVIFGIFSNLPPMNKAHPPSINTATPPSTNTATPPTSQMPQDTPAVITKPAEKIQVLWYVGMGAGSNEEDIAGQQAVVDEFNASQDRIDLVLKIDADFTYDKLATQIAAGIAPDIVGPFRIQGRDFFKGAWLDLQPYIEKTNYDFSDFDPALVEFYKVKEEGQLGIPFAISPSFIIYNADLFDEAGLNYPPANYGESYTWPDGTTAEWNMDTLREVAMKLTIDANGQDAFSDEFDPERIVQFGFLNQWNNPRGIGTFFGSGSLVADDGVTAQIPDNWKAAWEWTYKGWWEDYFIPNGPYESTDFLQGPGGPFSSGNLAMVHLHMWYVAPWAFIDSTFEWQLAATPSYNGVVTSKMHDATFGILKGSQNPDAAFEALTYMLSAENAEKLLNVYGGMPARLSLQDDYFDKYGETNFPGKDINWDIVVASVSYLDNPSHESYMPKFGETTDTYNEYWNLLANTPGADFEAETSKLLADLQKIFDAAK